jgi:hypothetical protein
MVIKVITHDCQRQWLKPAAASYISWQKRIERHD